MIETHSRRAAADELARKSGTRWRPVDEHRIEHPGQSFLHRRSHGDLCRLAAFASKVPRLTSSACAPATNGPISSGDNVIEGTQPAASSTLAVKLCATALVMQ